MVLPLLLAGATGFLKGYNQKRKLVQEQKDRAKMLEIEQQKANTERYKANLDLLKEHTTLEGMLSDKIDARLASALASGNMPLANQLRREKANVSAKVAAFGLQGFPELMGHTTQSFTPSEVLPGGVGEMGRNLQNERDIDSLVSGAMPLGTMVPLPGEQGKGAEKQTAGGSKEFTSRLQAEEQAFQARRGSGGSALPTGRVSPPGRSGGASSAAATPSASGDLPGAKEPDLALQSAVEEIRFDAEGLGEEENSPKAVAQRAAFEVFQMDLSQPVPAAQADMIKKALKVRGDAMKASGDPWMSAAGDEMLMMEAQIQSERDVNDTLEERKRKFELSYDRLSTLNQLGSLREAFKMQGFDGVSITIPYMHRSGQPLGSPPSPEMIDSGEVVPDPKRPLQFNIDGEELSFAEATPSRFAEFMKVLSKLPQTNPDMFDRESRPKLINGALADLLLGNSGGFKDGLRRFMENAPHAPGSPGVLIDTPVPIPGKPTSEELNWFLEGVNVLNKSAIHMRDSINQGLFEIDGVEARVPIRVQTATQPEVLAQTIAALSNSPKLRAEAGIPVDMDRISEEEALSVIQDNIAPTTLTSEGFVYSESERTAFQQFMLKAPEKVFNSPITLEIAQDMYGDKGGLVWLDSLKPVRRSARNRDVVRVGPNLEIPRGPGSVVEPTEQEVERAKLDENAPTPMGDSLPFAKGSGGLMPGSGKVSGKASGTSGKASATKPAPTSPPTETKPGTGGDMESRVMERLAAQGFPVPSRPKSKSKEPVDPFSSEGVDAKVKALQEKLGVHPGSEAGRAVWIEVWKQHVEEMGRIIKGGGK